MADQETKTGARAGFVAWVLLVGLVALVVWAALAGFFWYESTKGWTSKKLGQAIKASLPLGSTRTEVEEWLGDQGFPNSSSVPYAGGPWMVRAAGVKPEDVGAAVYAEVPSANVDWGDLGVRGRIDVTFYFDKGDKLLGQVTIVRALGQRSWPWDWLLPPWWLVGYLLLLIGAGLTFHARQRRKAGRSPIPNFIRHSTWRVRTCSLLLVCGAIASLFIYSDLKRRGPFWERYQQIQPEMTQGEVEAVLGPPTEEGSWGGIFAPSYSFWEEGEQSIYVEFTVGYKTNPVGQNVVQKKQFRPQSWWEKLWDR